MATKDARGTKRTCQNADCGERFYDLNKDPMTCPICGSVYEIAHSTRGGPPEEKKEEEKPKPEPKPASETSEDKAEAEDEADELADIETDDTVDDDDTFLVEEEQDTGDVTKIVKPARDDKPDT